MLHRAGDAADWTPSVELLAQVIDELRLANRFYLQAHSDTSLGQFVPVPRPASLTAQPETISLSAFAALVKE